VRPQRETGKSLRVNEQIRIPQVRLIDDEDGQIGIVDTRDAMQRARDVGLDLVEVAPQASPPVCRIMDYGKWKYQQRKREQKAKSHSKQSELKEVRVRPKTDDHDLDIKLDRAKRFLGEGHKVQFTMLFRGREMAHRDLAVKQLQEMAQELEGIGKLETPPRAMGRRMTMVLSPEKKTPEKGGGESKPKPPKPDAPKADASKADAPSGSPQPSPGATAG